MIFDKIEIKIIYFLILELEEEDVCFWNFEKFLEKYNLTIENIKKITEKYLDMRWKKLERNTFEEDELKVFYFLSLEFFKDFVKKKEKIFDREEFQAIFWFSNLELKNFQEKISNIYNKELEEINPYNELSKK